MSNDFRPAPVDEPGAVYGPEHAADGPRRDDGADEPHESHDPVHPVPKWDEQQLVPAGSAEQLRAFGVQFGPGADQVLPPLHSLWCLRQRRQGQNSLQQKGQRAPSDVRPAAGPNWYEPFTTSAFKPEVNSVPTANCFI